MRDKNITEYHFSNNTGDAEVIVYQLFPGVEVTYTTVHMSEFDFGAFGVGDSKHYASIHFCAEGRIEQQVQEEFFYLMPGDCSIAIRQNPWNQFQLPLKHYHGIHIGIDLENPSNPYNNIQMKLTVRELVAFGRFPYSGNRLTQADHEMIDKAIAYMELQDIADRFIDELSGGQRRCAGTGYHDF